MQINLGLKFSNRLATRLRRTPSVEIASVIGFYRVGQKFTSLKATINRMN